MNPTPVRVPKSIEKSMMDTHVEMRLTHPSNNQPINGDGREIVSRLTVTDRASLRVILDVELTAEDLHALLASRQPGSADGIPARVSTREVYGVTVGLPRNQFDRVVGKIKSMVNELALNEWAEAVRRAVGLHGVSVWTNQGGVHVTWSDWGDYDQDDLDEINGRINTYMSGELFERAVKTDLEAK